LSDYVQDRWISSNKSIIKTLYVYLIVQLYVFQSFKRRFFYLKQQSDATHVLEFHKDDKRMEAKGAIYLDSAVDVNKVDCGFI